MRNSILKWSIFTMTEINSHPTSLEKSNPKVVDNYNVWPSGSAVETVIHCTNVKLSSEIPFGIKPQLQCKNVRNFKYDPGIAKTNVMQRSTFRIL